MADVSSQHAAEAEASFGDWSMTRILDCAMDVSDREDVCVGDMIAAFGPASFLPLLLMPAMLLVSPLSGIPLFSSFCAVLIILVATQMVAGRSCVWLPDWVKRRSLSGQQLRKGLIRVRPLAAWFDRNAHRRMGVLFRRPIWYVLPLSCVGLAAMIPFLELVPFSSSLLGLAVVFISLGMLTRDGLWVLAGMVPFIGALTIVSKVLT